MGEVGLNCLFEELMVNMVGLCTKSQNDRFKQAKKNP